MKRQFDLRIQIDQIAVSRFSHEQAIKMEEIQRAEKEVIRSAHRLTELEQMQKKLKADILKMAKPVDGPDDDPNRLSPQEADEARKQLQFVEDELTQHRSRAEFIQREFNNRNSEMQALQSRQLEQRLKHELMIIEGHLEMLEGRKQLRLLELELKRQQPVEPEQPDDIDQVPAETP